MEPATEEGIEVSTDIMSKDRWSSPTWDDAALVTLMGGSAAEEDELGGDRPSPSSSSASSNP